MGLFDTIRDFIDPEPEDDKHDYNHAYFPPIALIEDVPGAGFPLGWGVQVALLQSKIVLNMMAILINEDLPELKKEIQDIEDAVDHENYLKALLEVLDFLAKLTKHKPEILSGAVAGLGKIISRLGRADNNLALDFTLSFEAMQNKLLENMIFKHLNSIEDYNSMYRHLPLPEVSHVFERDDWFADQRVAGPNPWTLERLDAPMANFPLTNEQYQDVMGGDDTYEEAIADGRVYKVDYAIMSVILQGSYPGPQKYIGAPIALFARGKDKEKLEVVAIQCGQADTEATPLLIRPTEGADESARTKWKMAKTYFQVSDGNYHEAISHLGRTHLLMSPFAIATDNVLGKAHPIGKLLKPHFEGTFSINNAAQASLIAQGGVIDRIMGGTIDMSRVVGGLGAVGISKNFDKNFPKLTLKARGVDDTEKLPYYPYRDCAMWCWDAIHQWVHDYVHICYKEEDGPAKDPTLNAWLAELTDHNKGRLSSIGENGCFPNRAYLIEALSFVIWTASVAHAAGNFPQKDIMSYTPAMPLAAYTPPPTKSGIYTEQDWMNMLPPMEATILQLNTGTLLGGIYYTRLGKYGDDYFQDPDIREALAKFQAQLEVLESKMIETFPEYHYLRPCQIPQSINI